MKFAYSNLLGEYVDAAMVDDGDCARLQIVCPYCHEATFKVERSASVHYISHYRATEWTDDCEARARRAAFEQFRQHNAEARGQQLKYFLSVLPEAAAKTLHVPEGADPRSWLQVYSQFIRRGKGFLWLAERQQIVCRVGGREFFSRCVDEYMAEVQESYQFSRIVQKRIVLDLIEHLVTPQAKPAFCAMAKHGAAELYCRLSYSNRLEGLYAWQIQLMNAIAGYFFASPIKAAGISERLASMPAPAGRESPNLLILLSSEIVHELYGALLRIRYLDLLADHRDKTMPRRSDARAI